MGILDKTPTKRTTILLLFITGLMWSIGGVLIKSASISPLAITSWRSGIAAVVLFSVFRKHIVKPNLLIIIGSLLYTATMTLFVIANKNTSAANAILLQYGAPIYVAFLSWALLKERIYVFDWISIVGLAGGMLLFFSDSIGGGRLFGDVLALVSGVTYAGLSICMRIRPQYAPSMAFYGNALTFLIGLPWLLASNPTPADALWLSVLGIFQLGLPYALFAIASKRATALEMVLLTMIEPLLNPLWVFLVIGEAPTVNTILGGLVVLAVIVFRSYMGMRLDKKNASSPDAPDAEPTAADAAL